LNLLFLLCIKNNYIIKNYNIKVNIAIARNNIANGINVLPVFNIV